MFLFVQLLGTLMGGALSAHSIFIKAWRNKARAVAGHRVALETNKKGRKADNSFKTRTSTLLFFLAGKLSEKRQCFFLWR